MGVHEHGIVVFVQIDEYHSLIDEILVLLDSLLVEDELEIFVDAVHYRIEEVDEGNQLEVILSQAHDME